MTNKRPCIYCKHFVKCYLNNKTTEMEIVQKKCFKWGILLNNVNWLTKELKKQIGDPDVDQKMLKLRLTRFGEGRY